MPNTGRYQTGDPSLLRQLNLAVVMRCLRDCAPIYRAQVAELTGLNKTTVSSLVSELIAQQYVLESQPKASEGGNVRTGRPAVMLELNPNAGCAVAGEVGVDYLSVAVANFTGHVIWRQTERTRKLQGQHAIVDRLLALLHLAVERGASATQRVFGIAVGAPALVARGNGAVLFAPNLGWENVPLAALLRGAFDCPLYIDNEANLAAVGEAKYGAARGHDEVLYISAGVGLGGGIIREGNLYRGASGLAGEFGHMRALAWGEQPDRTGERCGCGNYGCWETLVSERALFADIRARIARGEASLLWWAASDHPLHTPLTVPMVVDAAQAGDRVALEALTALGRALGSGIASLVNAFNPELVVLGGSLSLAGGFLLPVIETELAEHALQWSRTAASVVVAQHRSDACVMGGIATVIEASSLDPTRPLAAGSPGNGMMWPEAPAKGRERVAPLAVEASLPGAPVHIRLLPEGR